MEKNRMERAFKGVWIPADIWLNKQLSIQEKVMLTEIDSLDNEEGCFAGNKHFMSFMGLKDRRIKELINGLISKGFIKSKIIYKENSKEIEKRILTVNRPPYPFKKVVQESVLGGGAEKCTGGSAEKCLGVVQKNSKGGAEKCLDNNTINNTINNTNNNNNEQKQVLLDYFERIWKEYPNKKGKAKTLELYLQWIKGKKIAGMTNTRKLTKEQMYQAVKKYKKECEKNRTEQQYIKHGDTFFNKAILDYVNEEQEEIEYREYKELNMTDEEYQRKMNEGGKKYV